MSWITDLFTDIGTYGREFIDPENLAKSLGTAGVMSLFGGNSDDFARNFLLTNLGRTAKGIEKNKRPTAKSLNQQFLKLNPTEQQKYIDNFTSGNLSKKDFENYMNLFGGTSGGFTFEDYQKQAQLNKPLASMQGQSVPPGQTYQSPYGPAMNASYTPPNQVPISSGNKVAEVVSYDPDPSGLFGSSAPATGIASMQQGPMGGQYTEQILPSGKSILVDPQTGKRILFDNQTGKSTVLQQGAKKAPGFGEGIGFFSDIVENYPQQKFGQLFLEALDPDYYKKRDFQQEAEDRDKRLRNEFRRETLDPARGGFSRTMRARRYASGGIADLRSGGAANGPGTGTSDSIPARLSDGEFVMTAEAVRNMGNGSREKGTQKMYDLMNNLERRM